MKRTFWNFASHTYYFCICLYDELNIVLEVALVTVDNTEAVREDPHLHGSVCAAGEDVIGRSHLDLHDPRAEVPEQRLASVFAGEGVEWTLGGQAPNLAREGERGRVQGLKRWQRESSKKK